MVRGGFIGGLVLCACTTGAGASDTLFGPSSGGSGDAGLDGGTQGTAGFGGSSSGSGPGSGEGSVSATSTSGPADSGETSSDGSGAGSDTGEADSCGDGLVQPPETCDDANDVDADGCNTDCRQSGRVLWRTTIAGGSGIDQGFDVDVAPDGELYCVGYLTTNAEGLTDQWLHKRSAQGGMLWTRGNEGENVGSDQLRGIVIDAQERVYVAGYEAVTGQGADFFVRASDDSGTPLWTVSYNGMANSSDVANGLIMDPDGFLIAVGYENRGEDGHDVLVRKLSVDGEVMWTRTHGGATQGHDIGWDAAATDDGYYYVVGYETRGEEKTNTWVGKYDNDGNLLWDRSHNGGGQLDDLLIGAEVAPDGGVLVCGYEHREDIPWRSFVRHYDPDGTTVWTERYPGESGEGAHCFGIERDPMGDYVMVGGEIAGGVRDVVVRKITAEGEVKWTTRVAGGSVGPDYARNLSIGPDGTIYVVGALNEGTDDRDIFVAAFAP